MELCDLNLKKALKILKGELKPSSIIVELYIKSQFLLQIFEGINYLHTEKIPIIHRDLKLSNIVLKIGESGVRVKICDFGLSTNHLRIYKNGETISQSHSQNTGTPGNMPPEVAKGRKYNETSDIHCIGSIIMTMFCISDSRY
jgi:serine/threonine protein kinase